MNHMYSLLRTTCLFCHHFKLSRPEVRVTFFKFLGWLSDIQLGLKLVKYVAKLRLLEHGMLDAVVPRKQLKPYIGRALEFMAAA